MGKKHKKKKKGERMFSAPSDVKPVFYGTPTIYLTEQAARYMHALVAKVSMEVGWLMVCHETDDGDFVLSECLVPEQQCHATTTELVNGGLSALATEVLEEDSTKGIDINSPDFRYNHLNCWMHSHDNMAVSPSGQDDQQMVDFCQQYDDAYNTWVRGIVNKKGDAHFTVYFKVGKAWRAVKGCPCEILFNTGDDIATVVESLVKARVKPFSSPRFNGYTGGGGYQSGYYNAGQNGRHGYQYSRGKNNGILVPQGTGKGGKRSGK